MAESLSEWRGSVADYVRADFRTYPLRFCLELLAWAISIGCAVTMALTAPVPPLIVLYPVWIAGCCIYAWASYTRGSVGMLVNYVLLVSIDSIGLTRMLLQGT
jgi:hypothetical protein